MDVLQSTGIAGVFLYLFAYTLLQLGFLRGSGSIYTLLNMAAAICVLASLFGAFNLSSFLIQVSWIVISIVGLFRMFVWDRTLRFSESELEMAQKAFPELPRSELRRLLNHGQWSTIMPGTVLTQQGIAVPDLVYIASGHGEVVRDGMYVADVLPGSLVGEVTCLSGAPATATAVITQPTRCFRISAPVLRTYLAKRPQTMEHLERAFGEELRRKLAASANTVISLSSEREIA